MKRMLLVLLLVGCGQPDPSRYPIPTEFDYEGPTGIRIAVDDDALPYGMTVEQLVLDVENAYLATLNCMVLNGWSRPDVPGGTVHLMRIGSVINDKVDGGWTDFGTGHITMTAHPFIWWHEFVHYLLLVDVGYHTHEHPAFSACG